MKSTFDLAGKVAVITGAFGLLGLKHVEALTEMGAFVYASDISPKNHIRLGTGNIAEIYMDVTDENSIKDALNEILNKKNKIDILINNAAINPAFDSNGKLDFSRLENFKLDDWNNQVNVGLTGAFLTSKIIGTQMSVNQSGVILNIASDLSVIAPDQRLYKQKGLDDLKQPVKPVTYSVIKTGLIGLTRYLASYWANKNVRVNALSPGGVFNDHDQEFVSRLSKLIPLGRMAHKDEYKGAVQFLCSDASSYMTGQNLILDGGRSII